jgi:DNA-binding response OmpR family regulator
VKVLIVEDDENIRAGLAELLEREGYRPIQARDGQEGLELFQREAPDLVCLDVMMPGLSGYDVCREIRRRDPVVPVLFISARSEEIDRVIGLELGADDYILKPFGVREVVARIRAVTRRALAARPARGTAAPFLLGDLEVFPAELRAHRGDQVVELSLRDVKILELLHAHRGQVVGRDLLYERCWGLAHVPSSRTVDQQISQLRKRIEVDPKSPSIIRTVTG